VLAVAILFALNSCKMDPTLTGLQSTDKVTITKTTKFGKGSDRISPMKSQLGAVVMSHKVHEKAGLKCIDCHHKDNNDDRIKQCAVCHKGDNGYETLHGLCVDCHIAKKKGPQECMQCH